MAESDVCSTTFWSPWNIFNRLAWTICCKDTVLHLSRTTWLSAPRLSLCLDSDFFLPFFLKYTIYVFTWVMSSILISSMVTPHWLCNQILWAIQTFHSIMRKDDEVLWGGPSSRCVQGLRASLEPHVRRRHYENGWQYKLTYCQLHFQGPSVFPCVWSSNAVQVRQRINLASDCTFLSCFTTVEVNHLDLFTFEVCLTC